jgi:hypothetical protein
LSRAQSSFRLRAHLHLFRAAIAIDTHPAITATQRCPVRRQRRVAD